MQIFITGISGFAGQHLTRYLAGDHEIHGTVFNTTPKNALAHYYHTDLRDEEPIHALIADIRPDQIYHLAAQSYVPRSFQTPWETLENNIRAQVNLFDACRAAQIQPRILVVSSAVVYGTVTPDEVPIDEDAPLRPDNPYGVSKVAQDLLAQQYYTTYDWHIVRVRPFNHIGPGQSEQFVAPAFATQIARIEAGLQEPVIRVGDLTARRDFTDVRDVVRAYQMLMEHGEPGAAYNVSTGKSYSINYLLNSLLALSSRRDIRIEINQEALRPSSTPVLEGNPARLREKTGWEPQYTFEQTLADVLEDCRQRITENKSS